MNRCRRWIRTIDARVNHPPLYYLSYTAYRCSVCCDAIATISLYTSLPPPPREPLRDVRQCYRIYSSFQSLPSRSSRLAQVFHSATFPDGKTSLTSFGKRSWIVSLSLAYPASGWIFFCVSVCQRTTLLSFLEGGAGFEPAMSYAFFTAYLWHYPFSGLFQCCLRPLSHPPVL